MITLQLPVLQENIAAECERLGAEVKRLDGERRAALALLKAVQSQCTHPDKGYDNDARWPTTYCNVCSKAW